MIKPLLQSHWLEACSSEVRGVKLANAALGGLAKSISLSPPLQLHSPVGWSAPSHSSVFFLRFSFAESHISSLVSRLQSCLQESQSSASVTPHHVLCWCSASLPTGCVHSVTSLYRSHWDLQILGTPSGLWAAGGQVQAKWTPPGTASYTVRGLVFKHREWATFWPYTLLCKIISLVSILPGCHKNETGDIFWDLF